MQNQRVLFFTDSEALVHVINKQFSGDKDLMFFIRRLVLVCLMSNPQALLRSLSEVRLQIGIK